MTSYAYSCRGYRLIWAFAGAFAVLPSAAQLYAQDRPPTGAPNVAYTPTLVIQNKELPSNYQYPLGITSPYNLVAGVQVSVTLQVISTAAPAGVSTGLAASYVWFSLPSSPTVPVTTLVFTGNGDPINPAAQSVLVNVTIPAAATVGQYNYQIFANGFPVDPALGLTNLGTAINFTTTAPPVPPSAPAVALTLSNGSTVIPAGGQISIPFGSSASINFTATATGTVSNPITGLIANLGAQPLTFTSMSPAGGQGPTVVGQGQVQISAAGTYTLTASATGQGTGTTTTTQSFQVVVTGGPSPHAYIDKPDLPIYTAVGGVAARVDAAFRADTVPGSTIRGWSAVLTRAGSSTPVLTLSITPGAANTATNWTGTAPLDLLTPDLYTLTLTVSNEFGSATATKTFRINATPTISWSPAAITYGAALAGGQLNASAAVGGSPIAGTFSHNPAAGAVLAAGTQTLSAIFTPSDMTNYVSVTATAPLTVNQKLLTVTVVANNKVYDGTTTATLASTSLSGVVGTDVVSLVGGSAAFADKNVGNGKTVTVTGLTLGGSGAGNYTLAPPTGVTASIKPVALTITAVGQIITYGTAPAAFSAAYVGFVNGENATTAGVTGLVFSTTPAMLNPVKAGTYTITPSGAVAANYTISFSAGTLTVNKATPTVTWATPAPITAGTALSATQLNASSPVAGSFVYNPVAGTVLAVGTQTLNVTFTPTDTTDYNSVTASVSLTVNTAPTPTCGTAIVRHAPDLHGNAGVDGSLQVLLPEKNSFDGNVWISDSLLVPGTPTVKLNGHPTYGSTIDGNGSASPSNYTITLNGNVALAHVVRRTDAVAMPVVAAPPSSTGTRDVKLNKSSDSAGSFSTVRDLTVNGNVGSVTVPAGTYRDFTVNGNNSLILGVAGAIQAAVYNFRSLDFNGNSQLTIVGPVIVTVAQDVSFNGNVGNSDHPEWLAVNLYSGDLTLNGTVSLYGSVVAPAGEVTINGQGTLRGGLICDSLTINGNGLLDLCSDDDQGPGSCRDGRDH